MDECYAGVTQRLEHNVVQLFVYAGDEPVSLIQFD